MTIEWLALGDGEAQEGTPPARRARSDTSQPPTPEPPREAAPQRPHETDRRRERGKVIEHPLARVGALVERLAKAEDELQSTVRAWRDSEARFRKIFEDGPLGMLIFDPGALTFVGVNQRFADMLGHAPGEIVGRHILDFTHAADADEGVAAVTKLQSGDLPFISRESRYVRKSGEVIWGHVTSIVVRNDAGTALYGVKMIQDITERKAAEERLQSLFASVPVGLYRSTPQGTPLDVNPALVQILGYPDRESLLASNMADLYVDPGDRERWVEALERDHVVRDFEKQLRRPDGAIIWIRDSARAVRDGDGRVVCWEGAVEDITVRKRAQETTRALAEVGRELSGTLDLAQTCQQIVTSVLRLLRVRRAVLFQMDRGSDSLTCVAAAGEGDPNEWLGRMLRTDAGLTGLAVRRAEPAWSPDFLGDPRFTVPDWTRQQLGADAYRSELAIPLAAGGEVLGSLTLGDARGRVYEEEELRLLSAFASQAALALRNARLYEETRQERREAEVLADLTGTINASLDLGTVLQQVVDGARELCRSDVARIALPGPAPATMVITHWSGSRYDGYPMHPIEPGRGTGGQVLATGRSFRTDHYGEDPRISKDYLHVAAIEGTVAEMVVPIRGGDRVEGLLYVSNRAQRPFTDRDETILLRLADHAAIAIRNARVFGESERRRGAAESLAEVSRLLSGSLHAERVGERIVDSLRALLGTSRASLMRLEPANGDLRVVASSGDAPPTANLNFVVRRGSNVVGAAVRERRPVTTPDLMADARITVDPADIAEFKSAADRAVLAVPLTVKDQVIGALSVRDRTGRVFDAEEVQLAQAFADQAALALENARLFAEIQAQRDLLLVLSSSTETTTARGGRAQ